ncbi:uncharacterized protein LOC132702465 [Cylas formicarius]|uniref:uncharacterized protein LOC132702465 n=1 Tax=Cylas formicarius TaxID=197179 RepID=UPI0029589DF1|nr:uncharacterized protein LOC132702465 [Cylas formicarius]XP_060527075.1 uncharacterized protein LOC132702465 [Cylas formicarius]
MVMSVLVEAPKDGNCVLHSIAFAYLWPRRNDDALDDYSRKLFGPNNFSSEIRAAISTSAISTAEWLECVQKSRELLVKYMLMHERMFADSQTCSDAFMPCNEHFFRASTFEEYLHTIRQPGVWLGSLEIRAFSLFLQTPIVVKENDRVVAKYGELYALNGTPAICLVLTDGGTHYNCEVHCNNVSSWKRKDLEPSDEDMCLRSSSLYEEFNAKRAKLAVPEPMEVDDVVEEYKASGVKRALHGTIFQLELLMLYASRGKRCFDFRLATEMDAAEKFDDVVFQYKIEPESPWRTIFLQAKHKQDVDKNKITSRELTTWADDSFSLQKYFVSFCKIKSQPLFEDSELEQFVICTNTDFELRPAERDFTRMSDSKVVSDDLKKFLGQKIQREGLAVAGTLLSSVLDAEQTINNLLGKKVATVKPADLKSLAKEILKIGRDAELEHELAALEARKSSKAEQKTTFLHVALRSLEEIVKKIGTADWLNSKEKKKLQLWQLLTEPEDLEEDDVLFFYGEDHVSVKFKQDRQAIDALSDIIKSALEDGIREAEKKEGYVLSRLKNSKIIPAVLSAALNERITQEFHSVTNTVLSSVLDAEKTINRLNEKDAAAVQPAELKSLAEGILKVRADAELDRELVGLSSRKSSKPYQKAEFLKIARERLAEAVQNVDDGNWLKSNGNDLDKEDKIGHLKMALEALPEHLDEFVAKFRFVTKYPDVDTLNSLIQDEVGVDFNLLNASLVTRSFEKTMLDWLKQKLGTFISKERCDYTFNELKGRLNGFMTAGLSKAYPEELNQLEVEFSDDSISQIVEFLRNPTTKQIFHLITDQPELGALKVLQALKNADRMRHDDDCIFIRLKTLALFTIQKIAMDAFSSSTSHHVMALVCRLPAFNINDSKLLLRSINGVLGKNKAKKLILVSAGDDSFASKFSEKIKIKATDETSFAQLNPDSRDRILGSTVNFQGKFVKLGEFLDPDSANNVMTEEILLALAEKESIAIGNALYSDSDFVEEFYLRRRLQPQRIKLCALNSTERFFITNIDLERLVRLGVRMSYVWNIDGDNKPDIYNIAVTKSLNGTELYRRICETSPWNVHWLDYDEGDFYWVSSKNNWTDLQSFIDDSIAKGDGSRQILPENDLIRSPVHQRVVLIADTPGKGKSTFVTRLASRMKNCYPLRWIVRLNFNDYGSENHPQSLNNVTNDVEATMDYFISLVVSDGDVFSKNVLRFALTSGNVEVFAYLDGLDEVAPLYKNKAITLLQCLVGLKVVQLYITTRPHVKADVEEALRCPAYVLNSWGDLDKIEFLGRFFAYRLSHRDSDFRRDLETLLDIAKDATMPSNIKNSMDVFKDRVSELLKLSVHHQPPSNLVKNLDFSPLAVLILTKWYSSVPTNERSVMDIPLHLKMYAEILFKGAKLKQNINLLNLYSDFVDYKLNIFYADQRVIADSAGGSEQRLLTTVELTKVHQGLAAKMFFPTFDSLPGLERLEDGLRTLKSHLTGYRLPRVGLVQTRQADVPHFVHRSFGEYFLCQWLTEYLNHASVQKILLRVVLMEPEFNLSCYFFDDYVALNWNSLATLSLKEGLIREVIDHDVETFYDDTILHVAVAREHLNVIRFLLDKFQDRGDHYLRGLLDSVNKMQYTPLQTAAFSNKTKSFDLLLDHHPLEFHKSLRDFSTIVRFYPRIQIDGDVARLDILLAVVRFVKARMPLGLKKLLSAPPPKTSVLHTMVLLKRDRDVATLLHEINDSADLEPLVMAVDKFGLTAFALALATNASEVVRSILEGLKNHPDVLKRMLLRRDNGGNVLHLTVKKNNTDAVAAMLKGLKEVLDTRAFRNILSDLLLARNHYEKTVFYSSLEGKSYECIRLLLEPFTPDDLDFYMNFAVISTYTVSTLRGNPEHHRIVDVLVAVCRKVFKVDEGFVNSIKSVKVDVERHIVQLIDGIKSEDYQKVINVVSTLSDQTQLKIALLSAREGDKNILKLLSEQTDRQLWAGLLETISTFPNVFRSLTLDATKDGDTIFHVMASQPNVAFFTVFLLDFNQDLLEECLTACNARKQTCLHVAATSGQLRFIETLMECVQRRDLIQRLLLATDENALSPLELSAVALHVDTFVYLLKLTMRFVAPDEAVNLLLANTKYTVTLLYVAVRSSCRDIVSALIGFIREHLDRCFPGVLKLALSHRNEFEYSDRPYKKGNVLFASVEAADRSVIPVLVDAAVKAFDHQAFRTFVCDTRYGGFNVVHYACMDGSVENLQLVLHEVAKHLDKESVLSLLTSIDNPDDQCLPLHRVAQSDKSELASFLLTFGDEHLGEDLERMMFATNVAGDTPLQVAAYEDSLKTFEILLNFAIRVLEARSPGTLRRLLTKVNSNDRSMLYSIVGNARKNILDTLIKSLGDSFSDVIVEMLLVQDKHGRNVLFSKMYDDDSTAMIETLLRQFGDPILMNRLLTVEDRCSINPLEHAYWEADCEEDCYVKFLTKTMSDNGIDARAMLLRAKDIAAKREELLEAVKSHNVECVKEILRESGELKGKFLLYDDARLMNDGVLSSNNVETVEAVLEAVKGDQRLTVELLLQSSCLLWASLNCSHEVVKVLVKYAKAVRDPVFLSRFLLGAVTIRMLCYKNRDKYGKTIALLQEETNRVAVKLLSQKRTNEDSRKEMSHLTDRELYVLKTYVESNEYTGTSQEEILAAIKAEIRRRDA